MESPVSKELNLRNLEVIEQALPTYWEHFIFYGTLLGYHREGDIIENDDDLDIMIERKHEKDLINLIINYTPFDISIHREHIVQLSRVLDGVRTYVDIYFYDNIFEQDFIVDQWNTSCTPISTASGEVCRRGIPLKIPKDIIFPITNGLMKNIPLRIPNNPEECCRYVYGESFMTPSHKHSGGYFEILKPKS